MDLFTPLFPMHKLHKNFLQIQRDSQSSDRAELQRWCNDFPDRDKKLVKEFQTTFNSTFWEIYLYALFCEIGLKMDWSHPSPDFVVEFNGKKIVVEATIASAADGKTPEWEKDLNKGVPRRFREMNIESIIRLSNSICSKHRKYKNSYSKLEHVKSLPFVLAVAPFEQPHFNNQYDTPIKALLYDYYVDEDAYNDAPHLYPNGPPGISLGSVEKDNGSEIQLGFFEDAGFSEISAILLSTTATWGKVEAMSGNSDLERFIQSVWCTTEESKPVFKSTTIQDHKENIRDGLIVFHNPYASRPIDPEMFKQEGIVQVFTDPVTRKFTFQRNGNCLMHRQTINLIAEKLTSATALSINP
ncbi:MULTISPECIES: hypothetical protein [unclassified Shewanella]|uniref:hypothetical protein n=1 Tax=unclassified Shewanella TaxID=196818 RepID=UPI0021DB4484|nr:MULTISPECIES: hypothetical protein [unclassified Shewanella]MCU8035715.1 hypothetical protein [Shewanella sp. SM71]MCU8097593.1 hypothetical protein [Shewanella sp. SM102]